MSSDGTRSPIHEAPARLSVDGGGSESSVQGGGKSSRLVSFDALEKGAGDVIPPAAFTTTLNKDVKLSMAATFVFKLLGADPNYKLDPTKPLQPQMYTFNHIGLYAHYAGVGFTGGMLAMSGNFCFYFYRGAPNVCANASTLIAIPWGFKIFYAMATDSYRPFGQRRKPYMIAGWIGVLVFTFVLAVAASEITARDWIGFSLVIQAFLMLADVPADGYSVEVGQLEKPEERGQVLATGQRIRFFCTILGGLIQALLTNGPTTNPPNCPIKASSCWAWGFNPNQYYGFILSILFVLVVPILFLKEPDTHLSPSRSSRSSSTPSPSPSLSESSPSPPGQGSSKAHGDSHSSHDSDPDRPHTMAEHLHDIWETMQNPTTLYLLIFVSGNNILSNLSSTVQTYMQFNLIQLSNFQSGISSILSGMSLVGGILLFQTYFIQRNWRFTQYLSTILTTLIGLLWLPVYYDQNLMNAWFTIFLQCTTSLSAGIAQVLFAMAVIELAKKGQEATTYELIISTANSAGAISTIISTQLLSPMHANTCALPPTPAAGSTGSAGHSQQSQSQSQGQFQCPHDEVNTFSQQAYFDTGGPEKWMAYTLLIFVINIAGIFIFTRFLPRQKDQCEEWKAQTYDASTRSLSFRTLLTDLNDMYVSNRARVGWTSTAIATIIIAYEVVTAIALLNPHWSCNVAFGGSGCTQ